MKKLSLLSTVITLLLISIMSVSALTPIGSIFDEYEDTDVGGREVGTTIINEYICSSELSEVVVVGNLDAGTTSICYTNNDYPGVAFQVVSLGTNNDPSQWDLVDDRTYEVWQGETKCATGLDPSLWYEKHLYYCTEKCECTNYEAQGCGESFGCSDPNKPLKATRTCTDSCATEEICTYFNSDHIGLPGCPECVGDSDCSGTDVCNDGVCEAVPDCTTDSDCNDPDKFCNTNNECEDKPKTCLDNSKQICALNSCPSGYEAGSGSCHSGEVCCLASDEIISDADIREVKFPDVSVSSDGKIVATFYLENVGGDMENPWLIEIQPKYQDGLQSFVSALQDTCDDNYPENVHKAFQINSGESVEITLEAAVLKTGTYDLIAATTTGCTAFSDNTKVVEPYGGLSPIAEGLEVETSLTTTCGDGMCGGDEHFKNCPDDCISFLGDGVCDEISENCDNAFYDCEDLLDCNGLAESATCISNGKTCALKHNNLFASSWEDSEISYECASGFCYDVTGTSNDKCMPVLCCLDSSLYNPLFLSVESCGDNAINVDVSRCDDLRNAKIVDSPNEDRNIKEKLSVLLEHAQNNCADKDTDGDGVIDSEDNCPNDYNPNQEDICSGDDGDGDVNITSVCAENNKVCTLNNDNLGFYGVADSEVSYECASGFCYDTGSLSLPRCKTPVCCDYGNDLKIKETSCGLLSTQVDLDQCDTFSSAQNVDLQTGGEVQDSGKTFSELIGKVVEECKNVTDNTANCVPDVPEKTLKTLEETTIEADKEDFVEKYKCTSTSECCNEDEGSTCVPHEKANVGFFDWNSDNEGFCFAPKEEFDLVEWIKNNQTTALIGGAIALVMLILLMRPKFPR